MLVHHASDVNLVYPSRTGPGLVFYQSVFSLASRYAGKAPSLVTRTNCRWMACQTPWAAGFPFAIQIHSFQALFLGLASIAGHIVLTLIPVLGWTLMPLWSLLILVLAVVGAVKAYQNQTWRIPVIGDFAEKQV